MRSMKLQSSQLLIYHIIKAILFRLKMKENQFFKITSYRFLVIEEDGKQDERKQSCVVKMVMIRLQRTCRNFYQW